MKTQLSMALLLTALPALAHPAPPETDGLLVDLADDLDEDAVARLERDTGVRLLAAWGHENGRRYVVRGDAATLARAEAALRDRAEVEVVEPNFVVSLFHDEGVELAAAMESAPFEEAPTPERPERIKPNDPLYKHQWHFDMVNAEQAWARTMGEGVIVAVLDTGVSPGKIGGKKSRYQRVPDLKATEFVPGYNFVDNNDDPSDGHAHGTHVAGTIAQSTNNAFGVAGLAPKAKIMPVKVLSDRGSGTMGAIASGIRWAADHGAKVINMSLGGGGYSASMAKAVKYAHDKGVVVVCAAGNGGRERVEYPAAYDGSFAVSALGPDGKLAFYSSYGKELDIAAPGGDTRVDLNKDGIPDGVLQDTIKVGDPSQHGFFPFQGTSMATPHVAAAAALVISTGVTDPDRVEKILQSSARDLKDARRYGAGGLDAASAVTKAQHDSSWLALALGGALAALAVRRTRRRDGAAVSLGWPFALTFAVGAGGFFFLHGLGVSSVPGLHLLAHPLAAWPEMVLASHGASGLATSSALLALLPMVLLFGVKGARGALAGLAFGVAGYLLSRAALGEIDVALIPGHGALDAAWLAVNGVVAAVLGRLALIRG